MDLPASDEFIFRTLYPKKLSKAEKTQMQIIEAAIECYGMYGLAKSTPEAIAQKSKVSRPLILHYFKNNQILFERSMEFIRAKFQILAIEAVQKQSSAQARLSAYIDATFDWLEEFPTHARVWGLFLYYVSLDKKLKRLHSEWVAMGQIRIAAMIQQGIEEKLWKCHHPKNAAKLIQILITGSLTAVTTENLEIEIRTLRKEIKTKAISFIETT